MARAIVIGLLIILIALPITIFGLVTIAIIVASRLDVKNPLRTLSTLACPACSQVYGAETAELARQEYFDRCRKSQLANPHLRINFVRCWEVECPHCQKIAQFYYLTERLDS